MNITGFKLKKKFFLDLLKKEELKEFNSIKKIKFYERMIYYFNKQIRLKKKAKR